MNKHSLFLFDFDGTLVDSRESLELVFKGAYGAVGVDVSPEYIVRLMRVQLQQGYKELGAPEDKFEIFGNEIIRLLDDEEVLRKTKIFYDTMETLNGLYQAGKKLAIVTSNNRKHVHDVLSFLGIDDKMFSIVIGNKETRRHKPFPDPILKCLEELGVDKEGVCYVGDGQDDMTSAVAAGVHPILLDRRREYDQEKYKKIYSLLDLLK